MRSWSRDGPVVREEFLVVAGAVPCESAACGEGLGRGTEEGDSLARIAGENGMK